MQIHVKNILMQICFILNYSEIVFADLLSLFFTGLLQRIYHYENPSSYPPKHATDDYSDEVISLD